MRRASNQYEKLEMIVAVENESKSMKIINENNQCQWSK